MVEIYQFNSLEEQNNSLPTEDEIYKHLDLLEQVRDLLHDAANLLVQNRGVIPDVSKPTGDLGFLIAALAETQVAAIKTIAFNKLEKAR